mgnify:FL=1
MSRDKVPITNFSMLLKTFHISGMEMAEVLHVDSSLISKWRTNKRKFRANSQIFEQMIEYVMSLDKASDYAEVRKLLEEDYPDVNAVSKDRLKLYLKKWLIKAVKVEATEVSIQDFIISENKKDRISMYKFYGAQGKRNCILSILRMGADLETSQELWCALDKSQDWFLESEQYIEEWKDLNRNFLDGGNEIYVIHPMSRKSDQLEKSLLAWLPLYLTGKVYPYFHEERYGDYIEKSCVVLKDHATMLQYSAKTEQKENITYLSDDKETVQGMLEVMQKKLKTASPCFRFYFHEDSGSYMDFLSGMVNLPESQYLYMRFPFVNLIPVTEMEEILRNNNVDQKLCAQILEACLSLKKDLRRDGEAHFRYLIPKKALLKLLGEEKIYLDTVSLFCGKSIYISNHQFRQLLNNMAEVLTHVQSHTKIHEVTLVDDSSAQLMGDLNVLCKNNTCVSIFNEPKQLTDDVPWVLTSTELPIVRAMYHTCHHIWETAFPQNRNNEMVARQIQIMIQSVPVPDVS